MSTHLVAEDDERYILDRVLGQQLRQLGARLRETLLLDSVDHEDDAVDRSKVITPQTTCSRVTAQVCVVVDDDDVDEDENSWLSWT